LINKNKRKQSSNILLQNNKDKGERRMPLPPPPAGLLPRAPPPVINSTSLPPNPLGGGGRIGGGGGGLGFSLPKKKAALPPIFGAAVRNEERDNPDGGEPSIYKPYPFSTKTPAASLRALDTLHYYKLSPAEYALLNFPTYLERTNAHDLTHVLYLCGGRKGQRFTSTEVVALKKHCESLGALNDIIDAVFKSLGAEERKLPLSSTPALSVPLEEYVAEFNDLVTIVDRKTAELKAFFEGNEGGRSGSGDDAAGGKIAIVEIVDTDAELMKQGKPVPAFLEDLIAMYNREGQLSEEALKKKAAAELKPGGVYIDSLARFVAFLVACKNGEISSSDNEKRCVDELVRASADSVDNNSATASASSSSSSSSGEQQQQTQQQQQEGQQQQQQKQVVVQAQTDTYWSKRFFVFLKVIRELKTVPKFSKDVGKRWRVFDPTFNPGERRSKKEEDNF
jgi:hypothetical protein